MYFDFLLIIQVRKWGSHLGVLGKTLGWFFQIHSEKSFKTRPNIPNGAETSKLFSTSAGNEAFIYLEKTMLGKQNLIEFSIFPWPLSFGFPKGNEKTFQAFLAVNPSVFQECYIFELVDHEQPR